MEGYTYIVSLVIDIVWAFVCMGIAGSKNRSKGGWFVLGLLFGLISVIIVACLKPITTTTNNSKYSSSNYNSSSYNKPNYYINNNSNNTSSSVSSNKQKTQLDLYEEIGRYKKLFENGVITEEQYQLEKKRIEKQISDLNNKEEGNYYNKAQSTQTSINNRYIDEIFEDYDSTPESKMVRLKQLKDEGKINQEEYNKAINRI